MYVDRQALGLNRGDALRGGAIGGNQAAGYSFRKSTRESNGMSWLDSLFRRRENRQTRKINALRKDLDALMRPSVSLVDPRDLTIPEKRDSYALFTYGAITALAQREELDETEALAILVKFLNGTKRWHAQEVSRLVGVCMASAETGEGQLTVVVGERAMTQWLDGDAGAAVSQLAQLLRS